MNGKRAAYKRNYYVIECAGSCGTKEYGDSMRSAMQNATLHRQMHGCSVRITRKFGTPPRGKL